MDSQLPLPRLPRVLRWFEQCIIQTPKKKRLFTHVARTGLSSPLFALRRKGRPWEVIQTWGHWLRENSLLLCRRLPIPSLLLFP